MRGSVAATCDASSLRRRRVALHRGPLLLNGLAYMILSSKEQYCGCALSTSKHAPHHFLDCEASPPSELIVTAGDFPQEGAACLPTKNRPDAAPLATHGVVEIKARALGKPFRIATTYSPTTVALRRLQPCCCGRRVTVIPLFTGIIGRRSCNIC